MNLKSLTSKLDELDHFIILTHHNADVDAIASSLVLKEMLENKGKKVDVGIPESVSEVARKFLDVDVKIDPDVTEYKNIIVVDTSAPEQLKPIKIPESKNLIVIDHHIPGALVKNSESYVNPEAKSCSEIIYQMSKEMGIELTPRTAFLLASGIIYDTAHLRNADVKTFELLVELLKVSDRSYSDILNLLWTEIDSSERIANLKALKRIKSYRIGNILLSFTSVGSFEASVARNLLRIGADIAIVAAPRKDSIRISGRMRNRLSEKFNLAEVFSGIEKIIDGSAGGHDVAASANGKNPKSINSAFKEILRLIEKKTGEKAKEI